MNDSTSDQLEALAQRQTLLDRICTAPTAVLYDMLSDPRRDFVSKQIIAATIDGRRRPHP